MSWDVYVMELPEGIPSPADISEDFRGGPLMSRRALIEGIRGVVPSVDFSDPTWGYIRGSTYGIEIDTGDDPVVSFTFHVRGTGDEALAVIGKILTFFQLRAIDDSMEFFDPERSIASFHEWQAFRNEAIEAIRRDQIS